MTEENVGCVVYTESINGIRAEWILSAAGEVTRGTGVGIRLSPTIAGERFEGEYEITYSDMDGVMLPKLLLAIVKESEHYRLSWRRDNIVTDLGIGFESDHKLSAGWYKID